ncbi:quinoprotein dehydrogenase-associated SoxYZ-like carrier [Hyphomicrobium sp.]|uniref:quinoprotein dehydrogenase-associated SoxYZ-like carrier n=1 Tax=Hyphomicrobium sp. TaxID=82 RepID=UPI000F9814D5|nr:quinoprotein dehydrogenase-associated SoxYZ-like carrier [Hyphomicrobium sp.]RUP10743.1 MAG: quinoprotein dehydrogenase-associated SoxYZ-like carrier [Hyphomicrobium sp.]
MQSILRKFSAALASAAVGLTAFAFTAMGDDDPWPEIQRALFSSRPVQDDPASVQIFAPNQADDAAVVPISIKIPSKVAASAKALTLIIDRNPVPVAATFAFGNGFRSGPDVGERTIATRVRVDAFSRVRAVLETTDGVLHMASKFVIGSGGCSAPASKDPEQALAQMGKAHLTILRDDSNGKDWREARVMIKHPNFTGMQMNKTTGNYTPARFVNAIEVKQGNTVLWSMEGGISISEDPNIRFTFATESPEDLEFNATDTAGAKFRATGSISPPS